MINDEMMLIKIQVIMVVVMMIGDDNDVNWMVKNVCECGIEVG